MRFNITLKRFLTALLIGVAALSAQAVAQGKPATEAAKLKTQLTKLSADPKDSVEVKLRDGEKRSGQIRQVKEASFVLADGKTGVETEIPLGEVTEARRRGLSKGAKIALVAAGVAALGLVIFINTCGNPDVCR